MRKFGAFEKDKARDLKIGMERAPKNIVNARQSVSRFSSVGIQTLRGRATERASERTNGLYIRAHEAASSTVVCALCANNTNEYRQASFMEVFTNASLEVASRVVTGINTSPVIIFRYLGPSKH